MNEHEPDPNAEEQVEDLDVPESEGEDVKGGAFDAFHKDAIAIKGELKISDGTSYKVNPGGLNFNKFGGG